MPLPDFELPALEQEEVAAAEPATATASARIQVGPDWLLIRECQNEDLDGMVVFLRLDAPDSPVVKVHRTRREEPLLSALNQPEKLLEEWNWNRKLVFGKKSPQRRIRIFKTTVQWEFEGNYDLARWKFPHDVTTVTLDWLLQVSDAEIRRQISLLLRDPESDCAFAYRWASLNYDERAAHATILLQDTWEEFENILRYLVWHFASELTEEEALWSVFVAQSNDSPTELKNEYSLCDKDWEEVKLPEVVRKWLHLIDAYFSPRYNGALRRYTAVQEVLQDSSFCQRFYVATPSQHERLEAHLQLRDWLRGKVAPEEIPFLLGETQ